MAGEIRLFDVVNGLLVQVSPSVAAEVRKGRRVRNMAAVVEVLYTPAEEAARDAEEAAFQAAEQIRATQKALDESDKAAKRAQAMTKLQALGLSQPEIEALVK